MHILKEYHSIFYGIFTLKPLNHFVSLEIYEYLSFIVCVCVCAHARARACACSDQKTASYPHTWCYLVSLIFVPSSLRLGAYQINSLGYCEA